jgi:hypothetical protein
MKVGQQLIVVGGVALIGLGGLMIATNPGSQVYEQYATEQLAQYLKTEGCTQLSDKLGGFVQGYCKTLVDTGRPQLEKLISQQTTRQNYLLFSIYQTNLSLPSPVPSYHFETIGAFQNFYTYKVEQL